MSKNWNDIYDNDKELSYEDRKKLFRYHMHNSKVSEENAWKQVNEMIRMKIKKYQEEEEEEGKELERLKNLPIGVLPIKQSPIKEIIEKFWEENEDMFERVWIEEGGNNKIMYLDYDS